jgi:hypothetical protein
MAQGFSHWRDRMAVAVVDRLADTTCELRRRTETTIAASTGLRSMTSITSVRFRAHSVRRRRVPTGETVHVSERVFIARADAIVTSGGTVLAPQAGDLVYWAADGGSVPGDLVTLNMQYAAEISAVDDGDGPGLVRLVVRGGAVPQAVEEPS